MHDARYRMQDAMNLKFGSTYKFGCRIPDAINLKFTTPDKLVNEIFEIKDARFNQECIRYLVSGIQILIGNS